MRRPPLLKEPPHCGDLDRQVAVLDGLSRPRRLDQRFLRNWRARPFHKQRKQCDRPLAERRRLDAVE